MPYVIERVISGARLYAVAGLGPCVYTTPAHKATVYATREEAAKNCLPGTGERPVVLIRILKELY